MTTASFRSKNYPDATIARTAVTVEQGSVTTEHCSATTFYGMPQLYIGFHA